MELKHHWQIQSTLGHKVSGKTPPLASPLVKEANMSVKLHRYFLKNNEDLGLHIIYHACCIVLQRCTQLTCHKAFFCYLFAPWLDDFKLYIKKHIWMRFDGILNSVLSLEKFYFSQRLIRIEGLGLRSNKKTIKLASAKKEQVQPEQKIWIIKSCS